MRFILLTISHVQVKRGHLDHLEIMFGIVATYFKYNETHV